MKAYELWLVARRSATLEVFASVQIAEDDDRLALEALAEKGDARGLAEHWGGFGLLVTAHRPLYAFEVRPADDKLGAASRAVWQNVANANALTAPLGKLRKDVDARPQFEARVRGFVASVVGREAKRLTEYALRGMAPPSGNPGPLVDGEADDPRCSCAVCYGVQWGRCLQCGRARK